MVRKRKRKRVAEVREVGLPKLVRPPRRMPESVRHSLHDQRADALDNPVPVPASHRPFRDQAVATRHAF